MALDQFASLRDITTAAGGKASYTTDATKMYGGVFGESLYYPENLGTIEANHYVVFFINELVAGKYASAVNKRLSNDSPVFMQSGSTAGVKILSETGDNISGAVSSAKDKLGGLATGLGDSLRGSSQPKEEPKKKDATVSDTLDAIPPDYKRTAVCIALPPPEAFNTSFDTNWNMTTAPVLNLLAVGNDALRTYGKEGAEAAGKQVAGRAISKGISKFAANMLSEAGNLATKSINNPRREMMFDGVMPRRFAFQWNLYSRTPEEAKAIWDIIQMFKYHMLPEYDDKSSGFFINFPNTFDIEFHSNGGRNNWLPKSTTCALTRVDINYTPGGSYAFFKEFAAGAMKNYPDGSAPVGVTLALEFAELETLYRNRIDPDGDYTFGQGQGSNRGTF